MKASEKEMKCIEISSKIRDKVVKFEIKRLKNDKTIYILNPKVFVDKFWGHYSFTRKQLTVWKNIFFHLALVIVYIISVPFIIIIGINEFINKKNFNKLKSNIINQYHIDDEVSSNKSFSKLWDDKGLRNWGLEFLLFDRNGEINETDRKACLLEWFKKLYEKEEEEFNDLCEKIENEMRISHYQYHLKHPNEYVSWASLVEVLPEKISSIYGDYIP